MTIDKKLKFSKGNAKLTTKGLYIFSLPAGHACPFARECLSKVNLKTKKIEDGVHTKFRCFSASQEAAFPSVLKSRMSNFALLRECRSVMDMHTLILESLPPRVKVVRIHVSGDFFNQGYFDAWLGVAREKPNIKFYAYTKALPFWVNNIKTIPENFILTASKGGTHDHLIEAYGLRFAEVVNHPEDAEKLGLEIDHDDSHAMVNGPSFALLIHGTQPKGSESARALRRLKREGVKFSYSA